MKNTYLQQLQAANLNLQLSKPVKKNDNAQLIHKLKKSLQEHNPDITFVSSIERRGDTPKLYLRTSGYSELYTDDFDTEESFELLAADLGYDVVCEITSSSSSNTAEGEFITLNYRIHSISSQQNGTDHARKYPQPDWPIVFPAEATKESPSLVQAMKDYSQESIRVTIEQNGNKKQYSLQVGDERALKMLIVVLTDAASKKVKLNLRGVGTTPDSTGLIEPEDIDGVMGVFDADHDGVTWTTKGGLKLTNLNGSVIATKDNMMWIAKIA